jgi:hypothetical protein
VSGRKSKRFTSTRSTEDLVDARSEQPRRDLGAELEQLKVYARAIGAPSLLELVERIHKAYTDIKES